MKRTIERRKRGALGWILLALSWGFNALMVWWFVSFVLFAGDAAHQSMSEASRAGHELGVGLGVILIFIVWAFGGVALGAAVHFTKGPRELIEVEPAQPPALPQNTRMQNIAAGRLDAFEAHRNA